MSNDTDDIDEFDDEADIPDELAQLLSPSAVKAAYTEPQQIDQLQQAIKIMARRQAKINKRLNHLWLLERDRKLYGKIVIGAGSFIMFVIGVAGSYFAGWWRK